MAVIRTRIGAAYEETQMPIKLTLSPSPGSLPATIGGPPLRIHIAGQIYERLRGANGWLTGADGSPLYGRVS